MLGWLFGVNVFDGETKSKMFQMAGGLQDACSVCATGGSTFFLCVASMFLPPKKMSSLIWGNQKKQLI